MQTTLGASSSTAILAPITKVWEALTSPEIIKKWFFDVDTVTDWKVGSPLAHIGVWQGKPYEDKGTILKFEPPKLLVHTHWSALSGRPDRPENYQTVTWMLSEKDGYTNLTVGEVNIPNEDAQAISEKSWAAVLNSLKELLENS